MNPTRSAIFLAIALWLIAPTCNAEPPQNMLDHLRWARATPETKLRIERLEEFWKRYLPKEEGGSNPELTGYGDGAHVLAVAGCAWDLVRTYIEGDQKKEALKMLDWIQCYDSKSQLTSKPH